MFGGDESGGLLDWLIDECDAGHRPGVGRLAAEFERRYLGRPVPQGSLLDRMKTLWEERVASKVAEYCRTRSPVLCCRQPGNSPMSAALMRRSW